MYDDEAIIILKALNLAPTRKNIVWPRQSFGPVELAVCTEFFRGGGTLSIEQLVWFAHLQQSGGRVPVGLAYDTLDLLVRELEPPPDLLSFIPTPDSL